MLIIVHPPAHLCRSCRAELTHHDLCPKCAGREMARRFLDDFRRELSAPAPPNSSSTSRDETDSHSGGEG